MRQRLGLAAAMLGDPAVLVLDEPTNGLDPQGIRWLRGYVRQLADEGRTVLVSSHALSEVEQTADHVLLIAKGRLDPVLDARRPARRGRRRLPRPHPEPERLSTVLAAAGHRVRLDDDELAVDAAPEQVGELAATHRIVLHRLNRDGRAGGGVLPPHRAARRRPDRHVSRSTRRRRERARPRRAAQAAQHPDAAPGCSLATLAMVVVTVAVSVPSAGAPNDALSLHEPALLRRRGRHQPSACPR